jgi:sugar/nucleoside kinase (ribokinase family)
MPRKIIVSGVGCCLVDILYNNIDFAGIAIRPYLSKMRGDGGLAPGKLVFEEEFGHYSGINLDDFINLITGSRTYDKINIGGPSIVALIHAAQMTDREKCDVRFYGRAGNDKNGEYLMSSLDRTPVTLKDYRQIKNRTPSTFVLSDPGYNNGHGERMFINSIGAAWDYMPEEIDDSFFDADITVFGGTALVPQIHDNLPLLLKRAKSRGRITIVNTVFDFRNEKKDPYKRWPLGHSDASYRFIDLLITDLEEALRLSGKADVIEAAKFFIKKGVSSFIVTNGSDDIIVFSDGHFFNSLNLKTMPVSKKIRDELKNFSGGDTTGCGDNFAGGIIASLVNQISDGLGKPDLTEACCWGVVSGGFTCFYMGGTWFEQNMGEKLDRIRIYYEAYKKQISG